MHSMAAMQGMIRTVLACMHQAGATHVTHVQMALGVCEQFTAERAHQEFETLIRGTPIEGASLAIQWLPARYQCLACQDYFESGEPCEQVLCPQCGEGAREIAHQEFCAVRSLDVSFPPTSAREATGLPQPGQRPGQAPVCLIASEYALCLPARGLHPADSPPAGLDG